jgi:hypothetical protein
MPAEGVAPFDGKARAGLSMRRERRAAFRSAEIVTETEITLHQTAPGTFEIEVRAETETTHRVTLDPAAREMLPAAPDARLVEESFRFLLTKEPQSAILSRFELSLIARYFPDWAASMRAKLGGTGS